VAAINAPVTAALLAAIDPRPGDVVLDLAAGTGDVAEAVAGRGAQVLATDISPAMVEAARRRRIEGADHRVMDMQAIELPEESVDAAVSRYGYMLVPDPGLALRETRRVLRPGGPLAFATWAPAKRNPWATAYGPVLI
jgi:ubiquinone/menaquinone biosynthesis C-methylase UbiE